MKRLSFPAVILLAGSISLIFSSCTSRNGGRDGAAAPDTVMLRGIYSYGEELSRFMECGNDSLSFWLEDPDSLLGKAAREYEFFFRPWHAVYAELEVVGLPGTGKGTGAEYDSLLKVVNVLEVSPKSFRTECFAYDFWGLGNEPFWSVEISGPENLVALTDLGTESGFTYQYAEPSVEGDMISYEIPAEGEQPPLTIRIRRESCSDGMSDREYDYSIELEAGERKLKGCAIAGDALDEQLPGAAEELPEAEE